MPHSKSATPFLSLPDELLVEILSYCPVETILRVERTCKALHHICQAGMIWKTSIQGLDVEYAPSLSPFQPLASIPAHCLKRIVVNALRQHQKWSDPQWYHDLHVVDLPINGSPDDLDILVEPRILPGGKEILILICGRIELWSLETKERLWQLKSPVGRTSCAGFVFDVVDDGNVLIIAILFEDFETAATSPLCVYSFDLRNKSHVLLFDRTIPPIFLFRMMLQGDYFIATIPRTFQTLVINWRTGEALTLDLTDSTGNRVDRKAAILADNDLISFANLYDTGFSAVKLPISALAGRWSKAVDHSSWTSVSICPGKEGTNVISLNYTVEQERVVDRNGGSGPWLLAHRVFKPNWKPNAATEIFIAAYDCGPVGQTPTRLVSFRLQLSETHTSGNSDRTELKLIKTSRAQASQLPWNSRSLSNAGRMFSLHSKLRCFSLFSEISQPMNELGLGGDIVPSADKIESVISSVEPWSGAIAVGMPGLVKVINFV